GPWDRNNTRRSSLRPLFEWLGAPEGPPWTSARSFPTRFPIPNAPRMRPGRSRGAPASTKSSPLHSPVGHQPDPPGSRDWFMTRSVYRPLSLPQSGGQVLGSDLDRSESRWAPGAERGGRIERNGARDQRKPKIALPIRTRCHWILLKNGQIMPQTLVNDAAWKART